MASYLTETSLGDFLRTRLDPDIEHNVRVPGMAERFRPDYRSETFKIIVEIDGDQHYRVAHNVLKDELRDAAISAQGYRVVRVPYFVQLCPQTIRMLLPETTDHSSFLSFPHGFISSRVVFPADFCELGVLRFVRDLERFACIAPAIWQSLEVAIKGRDWRTVLPLSLRGGVPTLNLAPLVN